MIQPYFDGTDGLIVSTDDVYRHILRRPKPKVKEISAPAKRVDISNIIFSIVIIIAIGYGLINAPALLTRGLFYLKHDVFNKSANVSIAPEIPLSAPTGVVNGAKTQPAVTSGVKNNHILIERINLDAPINWDVLNNNTDLMKSLQSGLAQLKGNAKPNQTGNIFIVGHSSNFPWAKGNYKTVFVLLPELKVGDKIDIGYQDVDYQYTVSEVKTVSANDVSIMDNSKNQLSLMTCVPIGTNFKRLVVVAKPTSKITNPQPLENSTPVNNLLPSIR